MFNTGILFIANDIFFFALERNIIGHSRFWWKEKNVEKNVEEK